MRRNEYRVTPYQRFAQGQQSAPKLEHSARSIRTIRPGSMQTHQCKPCIGRPPGG